MSSQFVADRVFRFLEEAREAESQFVLDAAFQKLIADWGFDRWTATPIHSPPRSVFRPFEIVLGKPSKEWSVRYRDNGYFKHDAVINHIAHSSDAVWWSTFPAEKRLSHEEKMLFDEAREFGVGEGLTAPVRLYDGSIWVCALTGTSAEPAPHIADAARFAGERYVVSSLRLRRFAEPNPRAALITAGQAEIIELVSRGATLREAAGTLNLSPSTVYNQVADAKRRAMVKTTSELVHMFGSKSKNG